MPDRCPEVPHEAASKDAKPRAVAPTEIGLSDFGSFKVQVGDSRLDWLAEPVIGPATSGRTRWLAAQGDANCYFARST
jgi:hypothetical protein